MDKNEEIDNDCNEQEKRNNEDPGAARLGNFINYYRFNPVKFPNPSLNLINRVFKNLILFSIG